MGQQEDEPHEQQPNERSTGSSRSSYDILELIRIVRFQERPYTDSEIQWIIQQFTSNKIPLYQMSSWLMAICCNGLSNVETAILTRSLVESGIQLEWPPSLSCIDKHSTGGVGDKVSIVLAPLVACFHEGEDDNNNNNNNSNRLYVPMMAGRGLGHTGGTIDKLESIHGFRTNLSVEEFQTTVQQVGCAITSATVELCPADQKLYALRDVTGTVSSIALQTSSIMSKKIAENPQSIVLDVKYGTGSFQSKLDDAIELAQSMITTGEQNGIVPTVALLTRMDSPLGCAVGNFLEIMECIHIMTPSNYDPNTGSVISPTLQCSIELIQLIIIQATQMIYQSQRYPECTYDQIMNEVYKKLYNGSALRKFQQLVIAQGGDIEQCLEKSSNWFTTPHSYPPMFHWKAQYDGYIATINAYTVGEVCTIQLKTGRQQAEDSIDPNAGIWFIKHVGDYVRKDDIIAYVYHNNNDDNDLSPSTNTVLLEKLQSVITYSDTPIPIIPIVSHRVTSKNGVEVYNPILPSGLSLQL